MPRKQKHFEIDQIDNINDGRVINSRYVNGSFQAALTKAKTLVDRGDLDTNRHGMSATSVKITYYLTSADFPRVRRASTPKKTKSR